MRKHTQNILHQNNTLEINNNQKPCLVNAKQGFSVFYKNIFLYSKYNAASAIEKTIEQLQILPDTLILAYSPVLGYGLKSLFTKLPKNCFVLALEYDENLFSFSKEYLTKNYSDLFQIKNFSYNLVNSKKHFISIFNEIFYSQTKFKRVLSIEFSAIHTDYKSVYAEYSFLANSLIIQFWKNRMTLLKLGKLYSKNIFTNLRYLSQSKKLLPHSINKPIVVFGAGPSVDICIDNIKDKLSDCFIICVDSSLKPLLKRNIKPNIVIAVESQLANEKAFIGAIKNDYLLISDLTSRSNIIQNKKDNFSLIFTKYENLNFLSTIENLLENKVLNVAPMGSVGLYAIEIALFLRENNIPTFYSGLDFSYLTEKSHCNEAPSIITKQINNNRLTSLILPSTSYKYGSSKLSKDNLFTDITLSNYAQLFCALYSNTDFLYNLSPSELLKSMPSSTYNQFELSISQNKKNNNHKENTNCFIENSDFNTDSIKKYLENALSDLMKIKSLLQTQNNRQDELLELINKHDYLFSHFADGQNNASLDISFLKRVSSEASFFIKIINSTIKQL